MNVAKTIKTEDECVKQQFIWRDGQCTICARPTETYNENDGKCKSDLSLERKITLDEIEKAQGKLTKEECQKLPRGVWRPANYGLTNNPDMEGFCAPCSDGPLSTLQFNAKTRQYECVPDPEAEKKKNDQLQTMAEKYNNKGRNECERAGRTKDSYLFQWNPEHWDLDDSGSCTVVCPKKKDKEGQLYEQIYDANEKMCVVKKSTEETQELKRFKTWLAENKIGGDGEKTFNRFECHFARELWYLREGCKAEKMKITECRPCKERDKFSDVCNFQIPAVVVKDDGSIMLKGGDTDALINSQCVNLEDQQFENAYKAYKAIRGEAAKRARLQSARAREDKGGGGG
jgi:hypothetical protein